MHIFSDFAFDIFELLVQSFLLSGRESLLRERKQQKVLSPDVRGGYSSARCWRRPITRYRTAAQPLREPG